LPFENTKDYIELQDFIKEDIQIHFAKNYEDVFKIIFPEINLVNNELK
jgi:ATP-dependent Lon protease